MYTFLIYSKDHPLPSKKAPAIVQNLAPHIATEFANLPTGLALVKSFKSTEGTKPSLSTVYQLEGIPQGKDAMLGTEEESFTMVSYLQQLVLANAGS